MDEWVDDHRWTNTRSPWWESYQTSRMLIPGLPLGEFLAGVENAFWAWAGQYLFPDRGHAERFVE